MENVKLKAEKQIDEIHQKIDEVHQMRKAKFFEVYKLIRDYIDKRNDEMLTKEVREMKERIMYGYEAEMKSDYDLWISRMVKESCRIGKD